MGHQLTLALIALCVVLTPASLMFVATSYSQAQLQPASYLPIVAKPAASPTPTHTATPTQTPTATVTPTQTPPFLGCQQEPNPASAPNFPIIIDDIDKEAEIVSLKNISGTAIDLTGWHMCSINGHQEHTGLSGMLGPGQVRSFRHAGPGSIWHDTQRDDAALYDPAGQLVAYDEDLG